MILENLYLCAKQQYKSNGVGGFDGVFFANNGKQHRALPEIVSEITITSTETNHNQKIIHYPAPIEPVREVRTRE